MANPALKNGYISIATELVEKLATMAIPSSEMRIIWIVWRKTWGWKEGNRHKDWDYIALSQFEKLTLMKHSNVAQSLKSLVVKRLLLKSEKGYKFNQNYDEWVVVKRLPPVVKRLLPSSQTTTKTGSRTTTNNRNKETHTKNNTSKTGVLQGGDWNLLIDAFKPVNPLYEEFYKNTTERKALEFMASKWGIDKLHNTIMELPKIIGQPYAPKITKPTELKRDIGKLLAFHNQQKNKLKPKSTPNYIL